MILWHTQKMVCFQAGGSCMACEKRSFLHPRSRIKVSQSHQASFCGLAFILHGMGGEAISLTALSVLPCACSTALSKNTLSPERWIHICGRA